MPPCLPFLLPEGISSCTPPFSLKPNTGFCSVVSNLTNIFSICNPHLWSPGYWISASLLCQRNPVWIWICLLLIGSLLPGEPFFFSSPYLPTELQSAISLSTANREQVELDTVEVRRPSDAWSVHLPHKLWLDTLLSSDWLGSLGESQPQTHPRGCLRCPYWLFLSPGTASYTGARCCGEACLNKVITGAEKTSSSSDRYPPLIRTDVTVIAN